MGVGGLGSWALVVGWVAGAVEAAAMVAAAVKKAVPGPQAPLPGSCPRIKVSAPPYSLGS